MTTRPILPWRGGLLLAAAVAVAVPIAAVWLTDDGDDTRLVALAPSSLAPIEAQLDAAMEARGIQPPEWVFSGSQSIVAQLADGAPADVVLTADDESFRAARAAGANPERFPPELAFAENHLVLAVASGNPGGVDSLAALADPDLLIGVCATEVPCGRLAAEATSRLGVTAAPDTEESSVRALTTKLVSGELDVGLIYRTDAIAAGLDVVAVDGLERFTNRYWGTATEAGAEILDFLATDGARAVLADAGFTT